MLLDAGNGRVLHSGRVPQFGGLRVPVKICMRPGLSPRTPKPCGGLARDPTRTDLDVHGKMRIPMK